MERVYPVLELLTPDIYGISQARLAIRQEGPVGGKEMSEAPAGLGPERMSLRLTGPVD
jgi:hypothetical protein